jgi:hypothetical protein
VAKSLDRLSKTKQDKTLIEQFCKNSKVVISEQEKSTRLPRSLVASVTIQYLDSVQSASNITMT